VKRRSLNLPVIDGYGIAAYLTPQRRVPGMELGELYDQDFLRWTEEQATALRRAKNSNLPLDWDNLAEQTPISAKHAAADLERYGEPADAVRARVQKGGFAADEVLGDWFPDASP
jgi:hypothetical protein